MKVKYVAKTTFDCRKKRYLEGVEIQGISDADLRMLQEADIITAILGGAEEAEMLAEPEEANKNKKK